jgi:hypothetical protein
VSRIINPNAPPPRKADGLDTIIDIMRVIASYRKSFFDLEACKQHDGVSERLTPEQIDKVCEEQNKLMQDMVTFILYGAEAIGATNSKSEAPTTRIETGTQKHS